MKLENLECATKLAKKIENLNLLLTGKQANCWLTVTNKDGNIYTFNEEGSNEVQTILKKEREKLIVEYNRLDREK